ncbi:hypothetical protein BpHYR1_023385 [Brachionus plicatilis]|uniref:Uncharacterized protein n=1 Tax=Brachionus plicatilis TaxID=10195 RepID=A0A3M7QJX9_BRAPC|nr:hypothetical protein BpHYR1_023385 [Brachionus plicatilis]
MEEAGLAIRPRSKHGYLKKDAQICYGVSEHCEGSEGLRRIVLEMESVDAKMAILRNAKKLRESENEQYKKVYINEDRTPSERAADKKLREERDTRNAKLKGSATINGRELKFETGNDGKK